MPIHCQTKWYPTDLSSLFQSRFTSPSMAIIYYSPFTRHIYHALAEWGRNYRNQNAVAATGDKSLYMMMCFMEMTITLRLIFVYFFIYM